MFNFFKKFSKYYKPSGTGLIRDKRPPEKKEEDYEAKEILADQPLVWSGKDPDQWKKYPIFEQDGSGSCVAQTVSKLLGISNVKEEGKFVHYSARDIYSQRANQGIKGMWQQDALDIAYRKGVTLEQLMPSQDMTEEKMNDDSDRKSIDRQVALVGKAGGYAQSKDANFDLIANAIREVGGVSLACRFSRGDWTNAEVTNRDDGTYGHLVTGVDYGLWKGKRAIFFDNSWGYDWGFDGQGIITEDQPIRAWGFLKDLKNTWREKEEVSEIPKPTHQWKKDLIFGMNNLEVSYLQRALMYEELFPVNVPATGYYGTITAKAVLAFQRKYQVASDEELNALQGRKVGPKTRAKLNSMFN